MKTKKPILSNDEIERLAERLGAVLECDSTNVSLVILLIDHLERTREDRAEFLNATFTLRQRLFAGTIAADEAQRKFESEAIASKSELLTGELLTFPKRKTG